MSEKLGATGEYPQGKLNEDDEGELRLAVAADSAKGVVIVDFGKPVKWLAMPPDMANKFAMILMSNAQKALDGRPAPTPPPDNGDQA